MGASAESDELVDRFVHEVVAQGDFTSSWFMSRIPHLKPILSELDTGQAPSILEVGSYEGLSACFFLWRFPGSGITCIDTFEGSVENVAYSQAELELERRFDRNIAMIGEARVRKIRGDSRKALLDLQEESQRFDLVYVDGSHFALDVLVDAALSWPLIRPAGLMLFDDYQWRALGNDPLSRPGPAIDAFLRLIDDHSSVVFRNSQLALRKER
jgi:predicted O-methyltransferase YrrM